MQQRTQWQLRRGVLLVRLLPVLLCFAVAVWAAHRARTAAYAALSAEAVALGAVLLCWTLRTRVRLVSAGVEVRELRTRMYAWSDIAAVTPTYGYGGVALHFRDGSKRTLPAPSRFRGPGRDPEIDAAVEVIRLLMDRAAEPR